MAGYTTTISDILAHMRRGCYIERQSTQSTYVLFEADGRAISSDPFLAQAVHSLLDERRIIEKKRLSAVRYEIAPWQ